MKTDLVVELNQDWFKKDGNRFISYKRYLAFDVLNHISKHHLKILVIASHSNFREVFSHTRNLPKEIALEIIHRNELIGLNFSESVFARHKS